MSWQMGAMSFEIGHHDLLARIGKLKTRSGTIETPILLPVINPAAQSISPRVMQEEYGCQALITNAYIIRRQRGEEAAEKGLHELLDYDCAIMTDSGAYQILVYGKVEATPEEIVAYQERISPDIATILDIPTTWNTAWDHAKATVDETIERAKQLTRIKTRDDILWVAPIQGGQHLDLVAYSAKQVGTLPFPIHALGSPTPVMEQYLFDTLVEMIITAKTNMPPQRPLHLFGAGHPFMFAMAVALGCDMFDSAAYAIYARRDRYMSEYGTHNVNELEYLPCSCPICSKTTPGDLVQMPTRERHEALARHNLHASLAEVRRVKQAIVEGRLWEHLEGRVHAHPALFRAVKRMKKYEDYIERHSPATKKSGLFFFGNPGLMRPEVVRYRKNLKERCRPPENAAVLLLLPQPAQRPFHKAEEIETVVRRLRHDFSACSKTLHACVYAAPFGVVPMELDEVYPLSQHEIAAPLDLETERYVADQVKDYIKNSTCKTVVLVEDATWKGKISAGCRGFKRKGLSIAILSLGEKTDDEVLNDLSNAVRNSAV
jgi:7-cyano-7-deazaguanine tRNA-ribosyltransferase